MKKNVFLGGLIAAGGLLLFRSWANRPKKAEPMQDFDIEKFQGAWYEIARVDNEFDILKTNVIIHYAYKEQDNTIDIVQNSFNVETEKWETAKGLGKFRQDKTVGALKIRFYNSTFEGYNILSTDEDYQYALVVGRNLKYLWILSRERKPLPKEIKDKYLKWAELMGYKVSNLNWVRQHLANPFALES